MPRPLRIRLVLGLMLTMLGIVSATLGGIVVMLVCMPDLGPQGLDRNLAQATDQLGRAGHLVLYTQISGLVLAGLSFLYTFFIWASWFVGSSKVPASQS